MGKPQFLPLKPKGLKKHEGESSLAPDGSNIRELLHVRMGNFAECILPPNYTSKAVTHQDIDEIWYAVSGEGEIARKFLDKEWTNTSIDIGDCITIPLVTHF